MTHLWQSTLFLAAAWLLTLVLRTNRASLRYRIWFAASLKFLAPFSLLASLASLLPQRTTPPLQPVWIASVERFAAPFPGLPSAAAPPAAATSLAAAALILWASGFAILAACYLVRWRRMRTLRRSAAPTRIRFPVPVLTSSALIEPGVFGILRPVLLLPKGMEAHLTPAQLDAILAHELCHVRRRDNLTSTLHMAVQAVFWFHPLVWWLGSRLLDERERACDEQLLRLGHKPQAYASAILAVCKLYLESPLACLSGVTGANLNRRIEHIMTRRAPLPLTFPKKLLLATAVLSTLLGPVLLGLASAPRLHAQSQAAGLGKSTGPAFEVATIKPAPPGAGSNGLRISPGRVDIEHWSIKQLILRAYSLPSYQVSGPAWIDSVRFDVAGKFPEGVTAAQLPQMLQRLLAGRLGLIAHGETRELPVFALLPGKDGPKMEPAPPDPDTPASPPSQGATLDTLYGDGKAFGATRMTVTGGALHMEFTKIPMDALAQIVGSSLREPVVDMTGLKGNYHVSLEFSVSDPTGQQSLTAPRTPFSPSGPTLFQAVQQIGLRLERRKAPLPILVIDHIERTPTEN